MKPLIIFKKNTVHIRRYDVYIFIGNSIYKSNRANLRIIFLLHILKRLGGVGGGFLISFQNTHATVYL